MKKPMSDKSQGVSDAIEAIFPGIAKSIASGECPLCKKPITEFRDTLSAREYEISGMCQTCQDAIFNQ